VQASPSSQAVPSAFGLAEHWPVTGLQLPTLHASSNAEQSTPPLPDKHESVFGSHVSAPLQAFPSSQSAAVWHLQADELTVQPASCSEQLSTVQATPSSHFTATPPHLPAVHVSELVQVRPSLHVAPSAFAGLLQLPVLTSQVPAA